MKRNRGFTLTEILAVIVIISLLLLLIVPTIMNGIKNKENDTKTTQTKLIYEAASEFIGSFGDEYPDVPNSTYCISIKELIDSGYINDNVKDVLTQKAYDKTKSVEVKIDGKGNKTYTLSNATCTEKHNTNSITFNIYPSNDTWSTSKTVNINYPDVQGYSKQFYKSNDPNFDCNNSTWQTYTGQQITYDQNGKICARMVGDAGKENITNNSKVFRIDTIKPNCTFNMPTVNGKNGWYVSNVNFSITNTDTGNVDVKSGIHKWDITKGIKNPSYNNVGSINHTADTGSVTYYCHVRDKAGNENNNSKTFKKDSTKPTISFLPDTQTIWIKGGLNVTLTIKDATSGLAANQKVYYAWSKSNSTTPSYNKYVTMTNSASAKSTSVVIPKETLSGQYYLWIKQSTLEDMAGNKSNKVISKAFKFDNTPPIVNIEGNPTSWTRHDVTLVIKASDSDSGLASQPYSFDGGKTWTSSSKKTYTTNTNNIQIWVKDKVGNITKKTVSITKIDKTKPTCTVAYGSGSSAAWTNGSVVVVGNCNKGDNLSPCNSTSRTVSSEGSYLVQPPDVCDAAGNCNSCGKLPVNIDTTLPKFNVLGNPVNWTNLDATLWVNANDSLSGLASQAYSFDGGSTWTSDSIKNYSSNNSVLVRVRDKAGNVALDTVDITKVDKTPPRAPTVTGSDWDDAISVEDGCKGKGGVLEDVYCTINLKVRKSSANWRFEIYRDYNDDLSGVNRNQSIWVHNGNATQHPYWTDDSIAYSEWKWTLNDTKNPDKSSKWINYKIRSIDNAGNIGYMTSITINLQYV